MRQIWCRVFSSMARFGRRCPRRRKSRRWLRSSSPWRARNTLVARRRVISTLRDRRLTDEEQEFTGKTVVQKLFDEIAPKFNDRPGGYTRIIKLSDFRIGDAGSLVLLQLLTEEERPARHDPPQPASAESGTSGGVSSQPGRSEERQVRRGRVGRRKDFRSLRRRRPTNSPVAAATASTSASKTEKAKASVPAGSISQNMESDLARWKPDHEDLGPIVGTMLQPKAEIAGKWTTGTFMARSSLAIRKEKSGEYSVSLSTAGCLGAWDLQREGTLARGVIRLNKPVEDTFHLRMTPFT